MIRSIAICLLAAFASLGCTEEKLEAVTFRLDANPVAVDFGAVAVRAPSEQTVRLASVGTGTVTLESFTLEGADVQAFVAPFLPDDLELKSGAFLDLVVVFAPATETDYAAELVITGSQSDGPLRIPLTGIGKAPTIEVCERVAGVEDRCPALGQPLVVDFGAHIRGRSATRVLVVRNNGGAELTIFDDGTGLDPAALAAGFTSVVSLSGGVVPVGGEVVLPIRFDAAEQGPVGARLSLASNDPAQDKATVELIAEGLVNLAPTACAAVTAISHQDGSVESPALPTAVGARPGDRLLLTAHPDAGCSADTEDGDVLTYAWSLVSRPAASNAQVYNPAAGPAPGTSSDAPWVEIDAIGQYQLALIVTDGLGTSSLPATIDIDALPIDDLTVEISWNDAADLDAHLVAPGGTGFCDPLDCFWDTCMPDDLAPGVPVLDWGADQNGDGRLDPDLDPDTDPILVFDNTGANVTGTGNVRLETIRLPRAPAGSGRYDIAVHYFADAGVSGPAFEATVKVVFQGQLLLEERRLFATVDVGEFWLAGQVDISAGVGTAIGTTSFAPGYTAPIACP